MRFAADENFPRAAITRLRLAGHDVLCIRESHPGIRDDTVLKLALADHRTILTFDKDFGELAFQRGLPSACGIVLFRLAMSPPGPVIERIVATLLSRKNWSGSFWVVEVDRIRERRLT